LLTPSGEIPIRDYTESRWSCFIDAAPSWMTLWQFFLKKLDQAFDANQNPSLYEP